MNPVPYTLTVRPERIGAHDFALTGLVDFEATVDVICKLQDGPEARRWLEDWCPMFGVIWPAARAVAARVAELGPDVADRRCLELGCGLALPSLVAARLGAVPVATDLHPDAAAFLQRNLAANQLPDIPFVALDWRDPAASGLDAGAFHHVWASDVLYQRVHPPMVADMFAWFLAEDGEGWLTCPGRPHLQAFHEAAVARGLSVDLAIRDAIGPDGASQDVFLLTLRWLHGRRKAPPGAAG